MIHFVLGDAKEELQKLPPFSFDIIITDPPYGIGFAEYDNPDLFFELENEYYRLLKDNAWLIFWWSIKRIPEINRLNLFKYRWQIIVEWPSSYSKSIIGDRKYVPIFVYSKGDPKVAYRRGDTILADELPIIQSKIKAIDFKPTIALSQLLLIFTKENDHILDPYCGFGSLAMVCKLFNRNYTGIEIDEKRFKIAQKLTEEMKLIQPIPEMLEGKTDLQMGLFKDDK